jgi:hypothetical protein
MTLDAIIDRFQAGTLAGEPDPILHEAKIKVALWHDWRVHNPTAHPSAVPAIDVLKRIYDFIETTTNRRYGCND